VKIYIAQEVNKLTVNRILESALDSCTMTMQSTGDTKVARSKRIGVEGCKKGIARSK